MRYVTIHSFTKIEAKVLFQNFINDVCKVLKIKIPNDFVIYEYPPIKSETSDIPITKNIFNSRKKYIQKIQKDYILKDPDAYKQEGDYRGYNTYITDKYSFTLKVPKKKMVYRINFYKSKVNKDIPSYYISFDQKYANTPEKATFTKEIIDNANNFFNIVNNYLKRHNMYGKPKKVGKDNLFFESSIELNDKDGRNIIKSLSGVLKRKGYKVNQYGDSVEAFLDESSKDYGIVAFGFYDKKQKKYDYSKLRIEYRCKHTLKL